jgi:hypothetical protein
LEGNKMKKTNALIKTSVFLLSILIFFLAPGCSSVSQVNKSDSVQQGYNLEELNSYGEWVQIGDFGNVWRPYVVNDWMPFDNGHWAYADANWAWVSYEPFGWIVYHYGYWYEDPFYGWVWYPSNDPWSPARVIWVDYDDYIGWAPLPPRGIFYGNPWESNENHHWHVVKHKDFIEDNIRNYRVNNPIRNEMGGRDIIHNKPPERSEIEKDLGKPVTEVKLQHETIKLHEREIKKMNLPKQENTRVEQNYPRVKRDVLVPREVFRKREGERQNEKDNRKK